MHASMPGSAVESMSGDETVEEMVSLSVRVPSDLRRRLRLHAIERDLSAQDCVKQALTDWLEAHVADGTGT